MAAVYCSFSSHSVSFCSASPLFPADFADVVVDVQCFSSFIFLVFLLYATFSPFIAIHMHTEDTQRI